MHTKIDESKISIQDLPTFQLYRSKHLSCGMDLAKSSLFAKVISKQQSTVK